jgi:hypothetical protein
MQAALIIENPLKCHQPSDRGTCELVEHLETFLFNAVVWLTKAWHSSCEGHILTTTRSLSLVSGRFFTDTTPKILLRAKDPIPF